MAIVDSQDKANSINYVKSSVLAHFAAGGSSNSVILDAHVVERENQFLAAEADDEAAEDLCYALERFLEGMEEYETIVRRVSQHAASIPFVCSLLFCALPPAFSARLVPASAYAGQPASHYKLFADWYINWGGMLRLLGNRLSTSDKAYP